MSAAKLREKVRTLEAALTTETRVALDFQKQRDEVHADVERLRLERDDARRDFGELLDAAEDLLDTLRSWKLDRNGPLLTRSEDSGRLVGGWAGDRLQAELDRLRPVASVDTSDIKDERIKSLESLLADAAGERDKALETIAKMHRSWSALWRLRWSWEAAVYSVHGSGYDGQTALDDVSDAWDALCSACDAATPIVEGLER